MKQLFLALLLTAFLVVPVYAAPDNITIISSTVLDDDPTSATSITVNIQDYNEVGFWISYDETETDNSISAAVTFDISYDDDTWLDMVFYDIAGTTTLQTSETLSADGWYYCALPKLYFPIASAIYVRGVITATNTDADDTATVIMYLVGTK